MFLIFIVSLFQIDTLIPGAEIQGLQMKPVIISAQRSESSMQHSEFAVDKLDMKATNIFIQRSAPEILHNTANVFVQKTNHGGGSPILRGLMGNQILLLVDGIRMNNSTYRYGPNQYFNTIDPFSIQTIEVLRGTGSVQYGSDALGGIVHIFSEDVSTKEGFSGNILGRITSQNMEQSVHSTLKYKHKNFSGYVSYGRRNYGDLYGGREIKKQLFTGYGENMFNIKSQYRTTNHLITLNLQHFKALDVPITHKIILENFKFNHISLQQRDHSYIKHVYKIPKGVFSEINTQFSLQSSKEQRKIQKNGSTDELRESDRIYTMHAGISTTALIKSYWKMNMGVEGYADLVNSQRTLYKLTSGETISQRGLYPDNSNYKALSGWTTNEISLKKVKFTVGARYNTNNILIKDILPGTFKSSIDALVLNYGLGFTPSASHFFYIHSNDGFRAPNIDDMGTLGLVDFRYEIPAYNLKPEKSISLDAGYKYFSPKRKLNVSIYQTSVKNLISRLKLDGEFVNGNQVYIKSNIDKALLRGFEFDYSQKIGTTRCYSFLNYTFGKNLITGDPLRRIPPVFGKLAAEYYKNHFSIEGNVLFAGRQNRLAPGDIADNRIGPFGTPGWQTFNIQSNFQIKNISTSVLLNNIFNEKYKIHGSGIYNMGRSITAQLTFSF